MARVLIDQSYQLVLSPAEAGVLLALLSEAAIDDSYGEHTRDEFNEFEDVLISVHNVLHEAGVEETDVAFTIGD
jgi:hypothetical protein